MDRKKLALIHIVKQELGLPDAEYRDILKREAGVESARELTDEGFRRLMKYLVRSRYYRVDRDGLTVRQKIYIDHLSRDLGWTEEHLANFLRKYFKQDAVTALTRLQARKAIVALKRMVQHYGAE